ncbi:hypothetical protein TREMEDRAFT_29122, partial [Tremella mesenterica DSM 1558]
VPRKSNTATPALSEADQPPLVDRLSYADIPKPFKNPHFHSHLPYRTASTTLSVKKNVKQILTLERERYSGGDGFLSAAQTLARSRGETLEVAKKKKKESTGKRGNIANLRRGNKPGPGVKEVEESARTSPIEEEEEEDDAMEGIEGGDGKEESERNGIKGDEIKSEVKEVFTYHTPTAPPSLFPPKKYCDITGLHAGYTDPRTKLRYKGLEIWHVVRGLGPGGDQAYLSLRGAQTSLK